MQLAAVHVQAAPPFVTQSAWEQIKVQEQRLLNEARSDSDRATCSNVLLTSSKGCAGVLLSAFCDSAADWQYAMLHVQCQRMQVACAVLPVALMAVMRAVHNCGCITCCGITYMSVCVGESTRSFCESHPQCLECWVGVTQAGCIFALQVKRAACCPQQSMLLHADGLRCCSPTVARCDKQVREKGQVGTRTVCAFMDTIMLAKACTVPCSACKRECTEHIQACDVIF